MYSKSWNKLPGTLNPGDYMINQRFKRVPCYYEGEPEPTPNPIGGTPPPTPSPTPTVPPGFVAQEVVNRLVKQAEDKAKADKQKMISDLESLRQSANLSEQEKSSLTTRIDELQSQLQTKEQQQQTEIQKLQKKYDTDISSAKSESQTWRQRFEKKLQSVDIYSASAEFKAYNPEQIEAILGPITKTVEEAGDDGKPTGQFVSRVDFMGEDKDNKPVKLTLSVRDAVKAMSEMQKYANLFQNPASGGTGQTPSPGNNGRIPNIDSMTPDQYKAHRNQIRTEMAKR